MDLAEAPPPPRIRPNERNALRVQAVWEALQGRPRLVLKAEYPGHRDFPERVKAARSLGMVLHEYETHLSYAVGRVAAEFADAVCA
jgi:hypothetical protein